LDTYTLNPEYTVLDRAFCASRSWRAMTSGGKRFVRNDAANFQLSNEAFVALWQSCKGTGQLKEQYEDRISGFLNLIEDDLERSYNSMITAAKAVVYDWSRNDEHVVVKRESHERYLRRSKYESATYWLESYDHADGFAQYKQYLAERAVYGGAWGFTQAFQTTKSLQSRASRLRKKGVNLRHHERATARSSARINYADLNAYANSLVV
jgi:hypothetical protein